METSSTSRSSSAESLPDPEEGRGRGRKKPLLEPKGRRKPVSSDSEDKENTPVVKAKSKKKVLVIESSDSEPESAFDTVRKLETPARRVAVRPGQITISSDSDDGGSDGRGRAGSDGGGFINLYSPKFYKHIPPPDPA